MTPGLGLPADAALAIDENAASTNANTTSDLRPYHFLKSFMVRSKFENIARILRI